MSVAKAKNLLAKFHAITNCAEFIRSHGEEGFYFLDENFDKIYQRETKKLFNKLEKSGIKYWNQYQELGIEIDDTIDE